MNVDLPLDGEFSAVRGGVSLRYPFTVLPAWRRLAWVGLAGFLITAVAEPSGVWGQATRGATAAGGAADVLDVDISTPDPFRVELRRMAGGDHRQQARAIRDALRLKFDDDANRFLEAAGKVQRSDEQWAEMHEIISGASLLRVVVKEEFTAEARAGADRIRDGKRRFVESPQRLAKAIEDLVSGRLEREAAAARVLLSAGPAAVGPLADAAARQTDSRRRETILAILKRFGGDGLAALSQIALYGDESLRAGAIRAIDRLSPAAAEPHWVAAWLAPGSDESLRQAAGEMLTSRFGAAPDAADAERYFVDRLARQRDDLAHLADPDGPASAWSLDPDSGLPGFVASERHLAAHRELVDSSRLMHRLGKLSADARRAGLAIDLAYRYRVDPLGFPAAWDELATLWGEDLVDTASIARILDTALAQDDLATAVAAMMRIAPDLPGERFDLLASGAGEHSTLVRAVQHPVARVRYEAAAAIGRLAYEAPYAGSSNVVRRWIEMIGLSREPIALVVETDPAARTQIEQSLSPFGFRIEIVSSVGEALRRIDEGGDLRMVVTTSALPDRTVLELVDRIHGHPLTERVPILIHGPRTLAMATAAQEARGQGPVVAMDLPVSAAGWGEVFRGVIDEPAGALRGLEPLSATQRFEFRRQALEAAQRLAKLPGMGELHGLEGLETAVVGIGGGDRGEVINEAFGDPQLALSSASSSEQAQTSLVYRLLDSGQSAERYEQIAETLIRSFGRQGVQLESAVIQRLGDAWAGAPNGPRRSAIFRVIETIAERFGVNFSVESRP